MSDKPNACGTCTACCRVYAVPELNKPAGPWCQHCIVGKGCAIYEKRPQLCVDYQCLWLQSQGRADPRERLGDELRPDRCKVVFSPIARGDMSTDPNMMAATTMPGAPDAWRRPAAKKLIDRMTDAGMRVVVGPPATLRKLLVDARGEQEIEMTAPDANGMQWSRPERESEP
jgi:hypothetical protein